MSTVIIADQVCIPDWVHDLDSMRRWNRSEEYPEQGWVSFLDGQIWVDIHMEQLFSHNAVKTEVNITLGGLVKQQKLGYYFSDRAPLSNEDANLFTEPDGIYCSFDAIESGRVRLLEGAEVGYVEVAGTPDMVLEVISASSVRKDTKILRNLYWRAGIREYWLVDARKSPLQFDILRWTARGYAATRRKHGWLSSKVFGRSVRFEAETDQLGYPQFFLRLAPVEPS